MVTLHKRPALSAMDTIKSARSAHALALLGMDALKQELRQRGLKCGGEISDNT